MQRVQVTFTLPYIVRQEGEWFYSSCPVMDVHSQGYSREEAVENLTDALQLFLESCFERGTLEQVLSESGFMPGGQSHRVDEDEDHIDVPLSLVAQHVENRAR